MSGKRTFPFWGVATIVTIYLLISALGLGQEQKENKILIADLKGQGIKTAELDIKGSISEFLSPDANEIQTNIKSGGVINIKGEKNSIRIHFEQIIEYIPATEIQLSHQAKEKEVSLPIDPLVLRSADKEYKIDLWQTGSIHQFVGCIKIGNYAFWGEGDENNLLTFKVLADCYEYVRGKGKVIYPDSKEIRFGY